MLRLLLAGSLLLGFVRSTGNASAPPPGTLEATVRTYAHDHHFNGTLMVANDGRVIFGESFGLADRAFAVPCTMDTKYRIASITKTFTAVLVLQLAEQKRLSLDAPIRTYLPDFAGNGARSVTLSELLHHTSGLPNRDTGYREVDAALQQGMPQYQIKVSPKDLVASALYSGQLLTPDSLQAMLTPGLGGYGDGLWITYPKLGGKAYRKASRPGRIFGANGSFCHFEGVGFTRSVDVVILSNTNLTDLGKLTQLIAGELLHD